MDAQQALEMGIKLRLAFPKMNDEQNRILTKAFEDYGLSDVSEAIDAHLLRFDFVNPKALMDQVDLNARKHSETADARLNMERESADDRALRRKAEWDRIDIDHHKQDSMIADFNDEELQTLKELAIANSGRDENTKKFMRTKNPRTSRLLKSMIFVLMQKTGEVPA